VRAASPLRLENKKGSMFAPLEKKKTANFGETE
jgi:hypothetical protein